ncbi:inositol polyphosphate-5-phosphatase A-like [Ruditapes philippinarum]|uniref:inositol polyphosphate-5-phosphatase A-like n=1 Tax=Ruditapes philippinarum TaxID=129788 RepID=UPI00295AB155|nr:inositol polyphosphate-5-phosphatase A-like [Ruditapes philippinarum]
MEPGMVAIHCQEVGGKNYEASMQHVNQFVKAMLGSDELQKYDRARVFLDEDYTAADKFTALGNLYFIHECVEEVLIYDFIECKFCPVEGREVLSGNIENIQIKEKAKYPQNFFPEFKWSRKGFLRTRWNINNCVFDLINIHLFHDASNIVALQKSPSVYSENRYRALAHTLQRFETDQFEKFPYFIFGDFNFRLDLHSLLKDLTEKTEANEIRGKKNQISKLSYTDANNKVVLTIESKYFDHHEKHNEIFSNKDKMLNKYDKELDAYKDKLYEYSIDFPPSYPFSEDVSDGLSYMKTRCPSWCDRILLSNSTKDILYSDEKMKPKYDIIGKDVCMGDHKPVYLLLRLKKGKGKQTPVFDTQTSVERRKMLAHKISINGETVDLAHDQINIHDFAEFEKTDQLIPEFRFSIKSKSSTSMIRQQRLPEVEDDGVFQDEAPKKTKSFQDIARQVYLMENALSKWPRRPKSRHHSSSSEDLAEDDKSRDDVDPDEVSVHTDISELSDTENDTQAENKTLTNTNSNSHSTDDSELRKRSGVGANLSNENKNEESRLKDIPQKIDLSESQNISVHGGGVDLHEHECIKSKDAQANESKNKERSGRKKRCPTCVVL